MIRLAGAYLKKCRKVIAVYIGIVTIFFIVFFLSSVPVDTVQYAAFLSAVLMCIVGIIDFADKKAAYCTVSTLSLIHIYCKTAQRTFGKMGLSGSMRRGF